MNDKKKSATKKRGFDKKKIIKIISFIAIIVIVLLLVWFLYLYPRKVFKDNEKLLSEVGERYYEINNARLPKDEGRVISVTLDTLIKQDYLDGLYETYGNKLCDLKNSNVKAVNRDGEYKYYTYLKCGNFESDVDHEGPKITLNGSKKMTVSRGDKYNEPGVKSVVDDVDGEINVDNVTIKGEVDTSTVGTYEVTYTARDSLDNKTTVIRTVDVEESLSNVVSKSTESTNNYYVGLVSNNYLLFNNMLFRIVKINADNSIVIVSEEPLANVDYTNDGRFANSSLDRWLNDYFYNLLEPKYQDLIVSSRWCDDVIAKDDYNKIECSRESAKRKVGILSIQDYNNTFSENSSFLDNPGLTWYANINDDNNAWTLSSLYDYPLKAMIMNQKYLFNVRPAVTLNKNVKILDGDGSFDNPYILVEKDKIKRNTLINTREIGEYINYSGYIFRISNITSKNTTEIIMTDVISSDGNEITIGYENSGAKVYNPNKEGNIGYQVVNNMTRYISTNLFEKTKIEVPIYEDRVTYEGRHDTKKYDNIITIPSTFDIFSAKGKNSSSNGYWLIDSSVAKNTKVRMFAAGTIDYDNVEDTATEAIKIKAYLKKDVFITDGDGTLSNPFSISN